MVEIMSLTRRPKRGFALEAILAGHVLLAGPALAQQPPKPEQPLLLGQFDEWGAYTASQNGKKVCYALAVPVSMSTVQSNRPRKAFMFIASRPGEKIKDEVAIIFGYGLKPNVDASIEVAGGSYAMMTQNESAWVKNPAEEAKLVETLRKGREATVKGTSAKGGTAASDVYSLKGLAQALDKAGQECR
jgi:invasion protein IalB